MDHHFSGTSHLAQLELDQAGLPGARWATDTLLVTPWFVLEKFLLRSEVVRLPWWPASNRS